MDDVVEANVLALERGLGEVINIGSGVEVSLNQLIEKFNSSPIYVDKRQNDVDRIVLNVTKAKNILGWSSKKSII